MKRIISIITLLAVVLTFGVVAPASATESGHKYYAEAEFLNELGIVEGYEDGTYRLDNSITRMEFTALLVRMMDMENLIETYANYVYFTDVTEKEWGYKYVNLANQMGFIEGYGDGLFGPNDNVTVAQAVRMIVSALGYSQTAELSGGFPSGYVAVGGDIGLYDGLTGYGENATRGDVIKLMYNALETEVMGANYGPNGTSYTESDTTLLEKLGYTKVEGIITASYGTSLEGSLANEGKISIGGVTYGTTLAEPDKYIGYNVEAYVKENDAKDMVLTAVVPKPNQDKMTVKAEDIDPATTPLKLYYYESNKTRNVDIEADAYIIYNGMPATSDEIANGIIMPSSGHIELISNDNDDNYEVVLVWEYDNYVVETTNEDTIYGRYNANFTFDADKQHITVLNADGSAAGLDEIHKDDVVSVAKSTNGDAVRMVISRATAEGYFTARSSNRAGTVFTIENNGEKTNYNVAPNFKKAYTSNKKYEPKFNEYLVLYLDADGQIAGAERTEESGDLKWGYIISAEYDDIEYGTEHVWIRLLSENNEFLKLENEDKKKIRFGRANGITYDTTSVTADVVYDGITTNGKADKQIVKYQTNEAGYLTELYLAPVHTTENWGSNFAYQTRSYYNGIIHQEFIVDANTVCFSIPGGTSNYTTYKAGQAVTMISSSSYTMALYDVVDMHVGAVIVQPSVTSGGYAYIIDTLNSPIMLIEDMSTTAGEDGEEYTQLTGWVSGKRVTVNVAENLEANSEAKSALAPGMVIQYVTNADKVNNAFSDTDVEQLVLYRKVVDLENDTADSLLWNYGAITEANANLKTTYGTVTRVDGVNVEVTVDNDQNSPNNAVILHGGTSVLKYAKGEAKAEPGNIMDVKLGQRVFVRQRNNNTREFIIVED